ncbi:MAG: hypothetical protein ABR506_00470 [Candidatus Krumholzibacteriia bacterium]
MTHHPASAASAATPAATAAPHAAAATLRDDLPVLVAVALAAVLGRLPALGAWWALDDWGLLARAAGQLGTEAGVPARWVSQHLWWRLTWPVFGLDADAQTVLRIALHAGAALLVVRLAARARLQPVARLLAGLMFAATPLAFTPLYWAAGVQELLAAAGALGAVLAFTAGRRGPLFAAALLGLGAIAAKESALGLPVLLAAILAGEPAGVRPRADRPLAWALVLFLALAAVLEAALVLSHFATGGDDPYRLGGVATVLGNLGVFGFWLASPGPIFASELNWFMIGGGGALFLLWAAWAAWSWRRGRRLPAATLLACLLVLAPALPLQQQIKPYLAYLAAAAGALAVGSLLPRGLTLRPAILLAAVALVVIGSFAGMRVRMANRNELGFPADPVVRATALSWQTARVLTSLPWRADETPPHPVVLLQVPVDAAATRRAAELGERFVAESELQRALGGTLGPNLAGQGRLRVTWANGLLAVPRDALVLCEAGDGFRVWGRTPNALLYAALTDVGLGHFERARRHLVRAAALGDATITFLYDSGQMVVPLPLVVQQKEAFVDWTVDRLGSDLSAQEVSGLQEMFFNLLSKATGRPVAALTAGSRSLGPGRRAPADTTGTGR